MIVRPGQPSKMYSLSMASGQAGQGQGSRRGLGLNGAKAKAKPQTPSRAKLPRRESPLAAAARRAREAMAGGGVGGVRARSPGLASTPKLRKPPGAEPPPPTPCTPESPKRPEKQFAARSLIQPHASPERDSRNADKHPSRRPPGSYSPESPSPSPSPTKPLNGRRRPSQAVSEDTSADCVDTSVGSALADLFAEDPSF